MRITAPAAVPRAAGLCLRRNLRARYSLPGGEASTGRWKLPPRVMLWAMEAPLTEDQLRAELRAAGKQALVGFALGVAAAGTVDMTQAIAACGKQFQAADLLTVRGRAAILSALAGLEEFRGV